MKVLDDFVSYFIIDSHDVSVILADCNRNIDQINSGQYAYRENELIVEIFGSIALSVRKNIDFQKLLIDFFEFFESFLGTSNEEITIVLENYYVDCVYRDSYYNFFSNKHLEFERNSKRITFFQGDVSTDIFQNNGNLQDALIGNAVIRPIFPGTIGRTIIAPEKFKHNKAYIRTAKFSQTLLGHKLILKGFPFSSQDAETMSCAENTILNLMEYFGTRYGYYHILSPSDITNALSLISEQRVLPSLGMSYEQMSAILKQIGFAPIIYYRKDFEGKEFRRIFHYYIESGFPLPVAVKYEYEENKKSIKESHSIISIGHSEFGGNIKEICSYAEEYSEGLSLVNTADLNQEYIFMDDNLMPYQFKKFEQPVTYSKVTKSEITGFVVPLYKRVFLEARSAYNVVQSLIIEIRDLINLEDIVDLNGQKYDSEKNPILIRMFLTTSRNYKEFKALYEENSINKIIQTIPMPKFVWVGEYMLASQYLEKERMAFGEVIIDSTISKYMREEGVLYARFPHHIGYKLPMEQSEAFFDRLEDKIDINSIEIPTEFVLFKNNLL